MSLSRARRIRPRYTSHTAPSYPRISQFLYFTLKIILPIFDLFLDNCIILFILSFYYSHFDHFCIFYFYLFRNFILSFYSFDLYDFWIIQSCLDFISMEYTRIPDTQRNCRPQWLILLASSSTTFISEKKVNAMVAIELEISDQGSCALTTTPWRFFWKFDHQKVIIIVG